MNPPENGHNYIAAGDGPPLVLLHGMGSSLRTWDQLVPQLTAAGYRVYALDLLGHGRSLQPDDPERYHIDSYYEHFVTWLDGLGLDEEVSIIGHSMGAYLGLLHAQARRETVNRLVLLDPYYSPVQLSDWLRRSARRPGLSARVMRAVPEWLISPFVRLSPNVPRRMPEAMVQQMARDYKRMHPNITATVGSTRDLSEDLRQVHAEALVIWGEKDFTLAPGSFPRMVRRLPRGQAKPIPQAGHMPHLSEADEVTALILDFLGQD
jgi:pimeloyl-ACP methyl ester carboxylesterase